MKGHTRQARAFTLIELMVAFGIVAVAVAMIVPTIAKVRARIGDVTCQSNLRQLLAALEMYNIDHNGSMPYGFYYVNSGPPTWGPVNGNEDFISWVSELNPYLGKRGGLSPAFQCPEAQKQAGPHPVSYVMNFIVGISPYYELLVGTLPQAQTKPPSVHLMLREGTALIWDTPLRLDGLTGTGYLIGADIDEQRFWNGAASPQFRYFDPRDVYGSIPPGTFGNNARVRLGLQYRNIDSPQGGYPYQGNLRFRHNNQTECNVAFSDGSVRRFTAVPGTNNTIASHDALRRNFMINWPPGVPRNVTVPIVPEGPAKPRLLKKYAAGFYHFDTPEIDATDEPGRRE